MAECRTLTVPETRTNAGRKPGVLFISRGCFGVLWGLFYFVVSFPDLSFVQCHPWARSNKHRTSAFEVD